MSSHLLCCRSLQDKHLGEERGGFWKFSCLGFMKKSVQQHGMGSHQPELGA